MRALVAVDEPQGGILADSLAREGVDVVARVPASAPAFDLVDVSDGAEASAVIRLLADVDVLVLAADRLTVSASLVAHCDRAGVRIVPLGAGHDAEHAAALFGLDALLPIDIEAWRLADAMSSPPRLASVAAPTAPRTIAVWGPAGAPGRSTVAIELACELARGGDRVALADADSHAASIALALGMPDEAPGFAAACRQSEFGALDPRELDRISRPLGGTGVDVLTGINRSARWPELSDTRVRGVLDVCRSWARFTVVDVAAPLERDEEIVSDLAGPRRNAATLAALDVADIVVAVVSADPVGVARFLRAAPDLRAAAGEARILVVANRLRPGTLGVDARGQVRRTIERFARLGDTWFLPLDPRSADAALLTGRPIAQAAPRSPFALALRRFVGDALLPTPAPSARRGRSRAA